MASGILEILHFFGLMYNRASSELNGIQYVSQTYLTKYLDLA